MPYLIQIAVYFVLRSVHASRSGTGPQTADELASLPLSEQLVGYGGLPFYQKFKIWIAGTFLITTDAIHIYIGFGCFLISTLMFRIPTTRWKVLGLGILASLGMEVIDLYYDFGNLGFFRFVASLHDIVNTNLIPVVLVIILKAMDQNRVSAGFPASSETTSPGEKPLLAGADRESARSQLPPAELGSTSRR